MTPETLVKQKLESTLPETKNFGDFFAFIQISKISGTRKAFEETTDGLFPT